MQSDLALTYQWVIAARETLFAYLETLPAELFTRDDVRCPQGSIRNLLAHMADTSLFWVSEIGEGKPIKQKDASTIRDMADIRALFLGVDAVVQAYLQHISAPDQTSLWREPSGRWSAEVSPRKIFMHVITHEFHHKGQLVLFGRLAGSPFPQGRDTDLLPLIF